jgi:thiamine-phosphate pyrophosphorylase
MSGVEHSPPRLEASRLRLLAIADLELIGQDRLIALVEAAVLGGATAIQLRGKKQSAGELLAAADRLHDFLSPMGVPFFMNDRVDVAALAGAAGVHLGDEDLPVPEARRLLGSGWIGCTVRHPAAARVALDQGADYLGAGTIYPGGTKAGVPVIGIEGLTAIARESRLPVVASGGITAARAAACVRAGAAGVAVIGALFAGEPAPDRVRERAAAIRDAVEHGLRTERAVEGAGK